MTKMIFRMSRWEDSDYIVSARPDWEKPWLDAPIGCTVNERDGKVIAEWLSNGGFTDLEKIVKNGYQQP